MYTRFIDDRIIQYKRPDKMKINFNNLNESLGAIESKNVFVEFLDESEKSEKSNE